MAPLFQDLAGKVCVITGGSGVLGRAMCEALASAGVKTAIIGRNAEKAQALARDLAARHGSASLGFGCDVLDKAGLVKVRDEIVAAWSGVDFLINAAGGNDPSGVSPKEQLLPEAGTSSFDLSDSFFGLKIEGFNKVFDLNFNGTLIPTMVFAELMLGKGGSIVNVSSMSALRPLTKTAAYGTAKAAVTNLTQWLAVHLARAGVRVNSLAPGFFLTEQNRFLLTDEKTGELTPRGRKVINATPMGRFGSPEELQGAVLFLLSEASRFVTGALLPVDGGFSSYSGV